MPNELNALETKVDEVVALCRALRVENDRLREQFAVAEAEKQRLTERMGTACVRIEQLALQLPETKD